MWCKLGSSRILALRSPPPPGAIFLLLPVEGFHGHEAEIASPQPWRSHLVYSTEGNMKAGKRDGDLEQVWVAKTEVKQEAPSRPPGKLEQLSGHIARISQ
ncbi:MAG: hypothetical protein DRN12_05725, partial [Thermoplasmata archaeon]